VRSLSTGAVVVCCVLLAGCSGASSPRTSPETIEIFGPYRGIEADRFVESLAPFVRQTGVRTRYVGSVDFVKDLRLRVGQDNDPPDLAVVPQPGLVRQFASEGKIVSPTKRVASEVESNYPPAAAAFGTFDRTLYAVPFRVDLKSLVWYRPEVFAEHGWKPPRTLAELVKLSARIAAGGALAPWCLGIAAGSATGWAATDWSEDLVLRLSGLDTYRRWVAGSVPFRDPRIASAFGAFHDLVLAPGHVAGGLSAVVETSPQGAVAPLFADPPGCAMLKQADFAAAWMPSGTTIGTDGSVDWFLLPGTGPRNAPLLVGGDEVVQFRHSREIDALMAYLAGPTAGASWVREGGFLSPKSSIPASAYPSGYLRALADALRTASPLAFDASDQMPPDIGSDLLWREITRLVADVQDYPTFAARIDGARARERSARGTGS